MEVRFEYLMPREVDAAMSACPTLFLPLGTIEWHGLQNIVGLDALKAHALCVRAASRGGGIVHPPLYGGVGGLDQPHTFVIDPEECLESQHLRPWLDRLLREAARQGFKAVIVLTGHYGAAQQITVRESAVRMSRVLDIPILGLPEYFLALDEQYYGDHAAAFETSIMMHLFPDKVDLDRLEGSPPYQGVGGLDPKEHASAEMGERFCNAIIERLAALAKAMPAWDLETRRRFRSAEAAIVDRQLNQAGETGSPWAFWRNVQQGVFDRYPSLLAEGRFEEVIELAESL